MTDTRFLDPVQDVADMVNNNVLSRFDAIHQFIENLNRVLKVNSWVQGIDELETKLNLAKIGRAHV